MEVRRNRSEADARISAIYTRAAAERRQLTAQELDEVAALTSAAAAAEDSVRRGRASGF